MAVKPGKPLGDIRAFVEKFKSHTEYGPLPPVILATLRKRMIALSAEIAEGLVFANGSRVERRQNFGSPETGREHNAEARRSSAQRLWSMASGRMRPAKPRQRLPARTRSQIPRRGRR
jgi:hypothetical protein